MKNADKPAYPLQLQQGESSELIGKLGNADGLTKREYFAAMAMQGICGGGIPNVIIPLATKTAVEIADALLKELDK